MSEMVERMARAATENANRHKVESGYPYRPELDDWDNLSETARNMRRADMRAAVKAMYEPTEAVVKAGEAAQWDCLCWSPEPGEGLDEFDPVPAWQAMIDEALK
jgi:hypothetical protein